MGSAHATAIAHGYRRLHSGALRARTMPCRDAPPQNPNFLSGLRHETAGKRTGRGGDEMWVDRLQSAAPSPPHPRAHYTHHRSLASRTTRCGRCCAKQVAALYAANRSVATDDAPYAELWMGTHPSGPSVLAGSATTLKEAIEAHPALLLGDAVHARWGAELPMLFKVLSVASALSIQAHPDKASAMRRRCSPSDHPPAGPGVALASGRCPREEVVRSTYRQLHEVAVVRAR